MPNSTTNLSNFTQTLLENGSLFPEQIADLSMIKVFGIAMLMTSFFGVLVNCKVLFGFFNKNISSFFIMCASKSISNLFIILGYLCYNAPITIMNNFSGPTFWNKVVNQMVTFGIYLMGPVTQLLISLNRLLVFYFAKQSMSQNNQKWTLLILAIFWIISIGVIVLGVRDDCNEIFIPEILNWWSGGCDDLIAEGVMWFVLFCAGLSNFCNFLVVVKLMASIIQQKGRLDSESTARRKRRTRKLFIQNCIQDWIFAIDYLNSAYISYLFQNVYLKFLFSVYSNLFTYVLDGCIMWFFNYEGRKKKVVRLRVLNLEGIGKIGSGNK